MDKKNKLIVIICLIIIVLLVGVITSYALIKKNKLVDVVPDAPITVQDFKEISE